MFALKDLHLLIILFDLGIFVFTQITVYYYDGLTLYTIYLHPKKFGWKIYNDTWLRIELFLFCHVNYSFIKIGNLIALALVLTSTSRINDYYKKEFKELSTALNSTSLK